MRTIFSIIALFVVTAVTFAQQYAPVTTPKSPVIKRSVIQSQKAGFDQFIVDFDLENEEIVGAANYERAFWNLNDTASNSFQYAVLRPDTFPILGSNQAYPISYITGIRLDSLDLLVAHKNLSGGENKVILEFAHTDASWHPTSNVFASDTLSFTGPLFASNTLDSAFTLRLRPGTWYTGGVPVAIRISFIGAVNDTFLLGAGYPINGTCGSESKVDQSPFYPNSYAFYNYYNELLPTAIGGDIFQDCDGLAGKDSIADGFSPIQNWCASMYLSVGTLSNQNFDAANGIQAYPNPTTNKLTIKHSKADLQWDLLDISGRKLMDGQGLEVNLNTLPSGIYFLKVKNLPTFDVIKISKQ